MSSAGMKVWLIESRQNSRNSFVVGLRLDRLATLRACLRARSTGAAHVPYRESTLTRVLKDALTDAEASVALVACVSPGCSSFEHSLRTLRTAMFLTGVGGSGGGSGGGGGDGGGVEIEEQELKEPSVLRGGPKTWSAAELREWTASQPFAAQVALGEGMTGAAVMKLPRGRLRPLCSGDADVAKALFLALRVASKAAAKRDLEMRRALKRGTKELDRAAGFAKSAPSQPVPVFRAGGMPETKEQQSEREAIEARKRKRTELREQRQAEKKAMYNAKKKSMLDGEISREEFSNWCFKNGAVTMDV